MKNLWYLPLLALLWGTGAGAGEVERGAQALETQSELETILERPALGLVDLFRIAELANPELAMARLEIRAQAGRLRQAGLMDNPELTLAVGEMSVDDPAVRKQKVELSQALALGGRRGAAVSAARAATDQAGEKALDVRRRVLVQVHKWWADQIHFRELEAAFDSMAAGAEKSLALAQARFDAKAAPESHVTRARLEVYDLEVARQEFVRRRVRSDAEMMVLLGGTEVARTRLVGNLDPDAEATSLPADATGLVGDHPQLRAARLGVLAAEADITAARKSRTPDLNLFVAYGKDRPDSGDFVEGGIRFSLPIFDRNQGRVAETTSQAALARHRERLTVDRLEVALTTSLQNHRAAHDQLDHLAELIAPAAARALNQARQGYRSGRLMFLELVDAQRTHNTMLLRKLELRRDLARAEADLMSLLGAGPYADTGDKR